MDGYLTTREAAERRGLAHSTIRGLIRRGKIGAIKRGDRRYVRIEDVDALPARGRGRPKREAQ